MLPPIKCSHDFLENKITSFTVFVIINWDHNFYGNRYAITIRVVAALEACHDDYAPKSFPRVCEYNEIGKKKDTHKHQK